MKRLLKNIMDSLTDAALLEEGVAMSIEEGSAEEARKPLISEIRGFFQNFSVVMANAALLEIGASAAATVREPLNRHRIEDIVHPDECQYGDNDACFV